LCHRGENGFLNAQIVTGKNHKDTKGTKKNKIKLKMLCELCAFVVKEVLFENGKMDIFSWRK
jgi:hypothetical protein